MLLKSLLKWSFPSIIISPIFCVVSCNKDKNNNLSQVKIKLENYLNQNQNFVNVKTGSNKNIKNFQLYKDWKNLDDLLSNNYLSKYFDVDEGFKKILEQNNNEIFNKIKAFVIQPIVNSTNLKIIFYLDKITNDLGVINFEVSNFFESNFEYQNLITLSDNAVGNYYENINKFNESWKEINKNLEDVNLDILKEMLIKGFGFENNQNLELNKIINKYKEGYFKLSKSGYQIILSLEQKAIDEGYMFVQNFNDNLPKYNVEWTSKKLVKEN